MTVGVRWLTIINSDLSLNDGSATRVDDRTGNMSAIDIFLSSPDVLNDLKWGTYDELLEVTTFQSGYLIHATRLRFHLYQDLILRKQSESLSQESLS